MRTGLILSMTMLFFAAAIGCDPDDSTTKPAASSAGGEKRVVLIGFIGKSQGNPVFQAAATGARDAARELSEKRSLDIRVEVLTPTDEDAVKQAEAIESLTRSGANGIAVSCSEAGTVTPAIDKAVQKGIAVICFDSDASASKRLAYYGTDDAACGQRVMAELARAMGDKGTIAILAGNQSAPNLQARAQGVRDELAKHPQMKLLEPNGVFYHVETPEKAAEAVQQAQNANPNIEGWAMIGGWPLFTDNALRWPAGSVKVVSVDALPAQLSYVQNGYVEMLLAQDCYGWGYRSVEMLVDKIVNGKDPPSQRVIDPLTAVTKDNAAEFGKKWEKWLGKQ
jgi:ribose transport system substrate-binding protein